MKWTKISDYCMKNGNFNVCKVYMKEGWKYELWQSGKQLGMFNSFDEAKEEVKRINLK